MCAQIRWKPREMESFESFVKRNLPEVFKLCPNDMQSIRTLLFDAEHEVIGWYQYVVEVQENTVFLKKDNDKYYIPLRKLAEVYVEAVDKDVTFQYVYPQKISDPWTEHLKDKK